MWYSHVGVADGLYDGTLVSLFSLCCSHFSLVWRTSSRLSGGNGVGFLMFSTDASYFFNGKYVALNIYLQSMFELLHLCYGVFVFNLDVLQM